MIRKAKTEDIAALWHIFHKVVKSGDTYAFDPESTKEDFCSIWFGPNMHTYVYEDKGKIEGTYFLKANQPGLGNHIANAGYMVDPESRGKGIGRHLCIHSQELALKNNFTAMQFNLVVSSNEKAVALWKKLGFRIIGTIPNSFRHRQLGLVDSYIMFKTLSYK